MKSLPIIFCLALCTSHRALPAEPEPFRLQLNGESRVSLDDLAPQVSAFYQQREASQSIVNQRPRNEILKPPAAIASKLSSIEIGTGRQQAEEILGNGWFMVDGEERNSGCLTEYINRAFPGFLIQIWYGWTEQRVADGHLIRKTGPAAPVLARPAVLKTRIIFPDWR